VSDLRSSPAQPGDPDGTPRRGLLGNGIDNVFGRVVPAVVRTLDIDEVLDRVDVDELLDRIDVDRVLDRVDVDRVLDRVDPDRLLDRVDVDRVLDRVDPDRLLDRVDPDRLIDRVGMDRLVDRIDVDRFLGRVDVRALAVRADIGELVSQSTARVAESTLDLVRRQLVGVDLILHRTVARLLRRSLDEVPLGPRALLEATERVSGTDERPRGRVTGRYAGGVTRLVAAVADGALITFLYSLMAAVTVFLSDLVTGGAAGAGDRSGWIGSLGYVVWWFSYHWVGLAAAGRTPAKMLVGTRIVRRNGSPLTVGAAFVRVVSYPFSFILGLGLVGILIGRERRSLHDALAGSVVVYDWGERAAEMPAPLTRWLAQRGVAGSPDAGEALPADAGTPWSSGSPRRREGTT
jgi:uncharacterized RDD family membrane protein YckC